MATKERSSMSDMGCAGCGAPPPPGPPGKPGWRCWRCTQRLRQEAEREALVAALEKLRHCAHACGPAPCPHTRKFEEITKGVLPPRRVTPRHVDELRKG